MSHLIASSGRPIHEAKPYFTKPDHVMDILERWQGKDMTTWAPNPPVAVKEGSEVGSKFGAKTSDKYEVAVDTGLWKTDWGVDTGEMYGGKLRKRLSNALVRPLKPNVVQVSIGALGDSAYEYLLKQYLLSGRTEKRLLNMCKWFGPTCLQQGDYHCPWTRPQSRRWYHQPPALSICHKGFTLCHGCGVLPNARYGQNGASLLFPSCDARLRGQASRPGLSVATTTTSTHTLQRQTRAYP